MENRMFTILLADDEEATRDILKYNLLKEGFLVYTFSDGSPVLDFAGSHKPDLIISDWMMPVKSGIDLVQELRRTPSLKETPFLMISCNGNISDISHAYSRGVDDYLVKPFRIPDLKKAVNRLLHIA